MKIKKFIQLQNAIPFLIHQELNNELIIVTSFDKLEITVKYLKYHIGLQYNLLSCISGVDFLSKNYRFSIVYDLLSLTYNSRIRIKIFVNEITPVNSITNTFINADWWEREIWDLYGIYFEKHPDLRRLLTDYGFEGHPMRKDFPLSGFIEVRYDGNKQRIIVEPIELSQEFRSFSFETPW